MDEKAYASDFRSTGLDVSEGEIPRLLRNVQKKYAECDGLMDQLQQKLTFVRDMRDRATIRPVDMDAMEKPPSPVSELGSELDSIADSLNGLAHRIRTLLDEIAL